jgi:hypothetical protein
MFPLRQSTASQEVPLGPFLDSTDGNTAETALSIANTDIKLWKSGATSEVNKNSGGATHMASGRYYAVLDATDSDTLGPLRIAVHVSGALAVQLLCLVLPANVYDSLVAGSDKLDTNAAELGGTSQTGRDIGASVLLSSGTGTGQVTLSSGKVALTTTEHTNIADAVLDRDMSLGTDSGSATVRTPRQAFRAIRNKHDFAAGVVYKENDSDPSWSYSKTTDGGAEPITGIDPASS